MQRKAGSPELDKGQQWEAGSHRFYKGEQGKAGDTGLHM